MIAIIDQETIFHVKTDLRAWQGIVFHCTAQKPKEIRPNFLYAHSIDVDHRTPKPKGRGFTNGMGYHFLINQSGIVEIADRWANQLQGAHCPEQGNNHTHIGISYVGNGDIALPLDAQMSALAWLWFELSKQFHFYLHQFRFHNEFTNLKTCPGKLCQKQAFLKFLSSIK